MADRFWLWWYKNRDTLPEYALALMLAVIFILAVLGMSVTSGR